MSEKKQPGPGGAAAGARAGRESIERAQQALGSAVAMASAAVADAVTRVGGAGAGQQGVTDTLEAIARSQRAVAEALEQRNGGEAAVEQRTADAVARASRVAASAMSAGIAAEQQSIQAAQKSLSEAMAATARAVAEANQQLDRSVPRSA